MSISRCRPVETCLHTEGFTMVELMICVAIIIILTVIAIPVITNWVARSQLKVGASQVYATLQYARSTAIKSNTDVAVLFDTANDTYTIYLDDGAGGGTAGDGTQNGTEATVKEGRIQSGVNMYQTSFNVKINQAYFSGRGLAESGWGYVYLKSSHEKYKRITVWTTGHIKIESSEDGFVWG